MQNKLLFLLMAIVTFSTLLSQSAFAQLVGGYPSSTTLRPWVELIVGNTSFPDSWLAFPNIIYYLILPFVAIVAVVYGIISDLRIFRRTRWVRGVIAVAMAGMTLPSGWLISAVLALYSFDAAFAAIAFGVVFFIGVIMWAVGTTVGMGLRTVSEYQVAKARTSSLGDLSKEIRDLEGELAQLTDEIGHARPGEDTGPKEKRAQEIRNKLIMLKSRRGTVADMI